MIHEITDESFDAEVAQSEAPCVLTFSAGWCTMCDEMAPALEALSESLGSAIKVCRINIDEQRGLRIKFAVAAIPYIVYVANGTKTPLFDGLTTAERLEERVRFMLDGGEAPTTMPL